MSLFKVGTSTNNFEVDDSGNAIATGGLQAGGGVQATGSVVAGAAIEGLTELLGDESDGGQMETLSASYTATLSTSEATTSIDANLPAGAVILGAAVKVTTAIAGVTGGVVGALTASGGSSATLVSNIATALASTGQKALAGAELTAETDLVYTLSGGADVTPSAGAIRVKIWYRRLTSLT